MISNITEALLGLMDIVWLMVIAVLLMLTIPIWVIPYTAYKLWRGNT